MTAPRRLGLDVTPVTAVQHREGRRLDRMTYGQRTFALKGFTDTAPATAVPADALLRATGVAILRAHGHGPDALLLEDLATSSRWRQAAEGDIATAAVGIAVAVDRPRFPAWAVPLRRSVASGALAADLSRALAFLDRRSP